VVQMIPLVVEHHFVSLVRNLLLAPSVGSQLIREFDLENEINNQSRKET
jgi:hypothetical protein